MRQARKECQICWPQRCRDPQHGDTYPFPQLDPVVCPDCGNDQLIYEPERCAEEAYLRCECGWSEG